MEEKQIYFPSDKHEKALGHVLLRCAPAPTVTGLTENSPVTDSIPQELQVPRLRSALSALPGAGFLSAVFVQTQGYGSFSLRSRPSVHRQPRSKGPFLRTSPFSASRGRRAGAR